jgi:type IV secretion/conjugal transfer VirB4 family ATPase
MLNIAKTIKPWKEAGSLSAQLSLYGFWSDTTALTKRGDLMMVVHSHGVDYESVDSAEQQYAVRRMGSGLKGFGEGFVVHQYLFKTNSPEIPFASYGDEVVDTAIDHRRRYFEAKRDRLYRVEIFYVIVLEGQRSQAGIMAALKRMPSDPRGGLRELKAQFSGNKMKVLLRKQIDADQQKLESRVRDFVRQLSDLMQIDVLDQQGQFTFYRRLLNFDDWRIAGKPKTTQFLDFQVVNSDVEAERDHLRIGDHYVRLLTMKEAIGETRPMVLDKLLKINANFHVVTEWRPISTARARKEITTRRRHFNVAKTGFFSQMRDENKLERDQLIDESKQADVEQLGLCMRALGDGETMGYFTLTIVLNSRDLDTITRQIGEFTGIFTNADGTLFLETYNQLNALFATIPGNSVHNLRQMYLLGNNYADLSFLFTIHSGELTNPHLGTEYLAVLETDNATPYYLNLHNGEVAHTFISGMSGTGKTFLAIFLTIYLQKYRPLTVIFDIGGSFESVTEIFSGSYLNVGRESRDFSINPFSLEPTKENLQFLASFFRVLLEGSDDRFRLDYKEERKLWEAIERMYVVPVEQRTLSTFATIIGELRERLHRWTRDGQYGFLFDNVEDTLSFSEFQTFNFAGWGDSPDALDALLFYVLHRAANRIADPQNLGTFKVFLMDEAWLFIKNPTIREYVISAQKTWRKHNAAMILATQSISELESSGMLEIVAESCPTKIFLANPEMNRETYAKAFHLNDTELDLIADLVPPGEMLIRKAQSSKKVRLEVDSVSYWIATNNARDNLLKREYFSRYGIAEGIRRLAHDYPFHPTRGAAPKALLPAATAPPTVTLASR